LFGESRTGIGFAERLRGGVTGGRGRVGGGERSDHVGGTAEAGTARDCDSLRAEVGGPRREDDGGLPLDWGGKIRAVFVSGWEACGGTGASESQNESSRSSALSSATTASILRRLWVGMLNSSGTWWFCDGDR